MISSYFKRICTKTCRWNACRHFTGCYDTVMFTNGRQYSSKLGIGFKKSTNPIIHLKRCQRCSLFSYLSLQRVRLLLSSLSHSHSQQSRLMCTRVCLMMWPNEVISFSYDSVTTKVLFETDWLVLAVFILPQRKRGSHGRRYIMYSSDIKGWHSFQNAWLLKHTSKYRRVLTPSWCSSSV